MNILGTVWTLIFCLQFPGCASNPRRALSKPYKKCLNFQYFLYKNNGQYFGHLSVESGFFLILPRRHCLSKMSKITQILYIVSGPCMVHRNARQFLLFLFGEIANILLKIIATHRKPQSSVKFPYTIISCSRRGKQISNKKSCGNYKYTGHSLDTINSNCSLLLAKLFGLSYSALFTYFWTL